ncbi:MAG TPA: hypothetical protein VHE30_25570 [Polyangiaceae bacterium]|nr:hypothetical protein [Polyangiaceae bacterium]
MKRFASLALLACLAGLGSSGCATHDGYGVEWLYSEHIKDRLDADWFVRNVYDGKGLAVVELMYCPMVPGQAVVCRTSVVWQRNARALLDNPRLSPPGAVSGD